MSDFPDFDTDQSARPQKYIPQSLDSPLLSTDLDTLELGRPGARIEDYPEIKSRPSLAQSRRYWNLYLNWSDRPSNISHRRWNCSTTVDLIERLIHEGFDPLPEPRLAPRRMAEVNTGLVSRGLPTTRIAGLSNETRSVGGAASAMRSAWDKLSTLRPDSSTCIRLAQGDYIYLTIFGGAAKLGSSSFSAPLHFFLAVLHSLESIFNTGASFDVHSLRHDNPLLSTSTLLRVARWQWNVVRRYGTGGYAVVKAPEAMFKAHVSRITQGDYTGIQSTWSLMTEKYREKERSLGGSAPFEIEELERLCLEATTVREACELYGSYHFSGFPIISPTASGRSALEECQRPDMSDPSAIMNIVRVLKMLLIRGFVEKEGMWPPVTWSDEGSRTALHRLWETRSISLNDNSCPLDDYDHVSIGKIAEFDYSDNYLELIDDKACFEGVDLRERRYRGEQVGQEHTRLLSNILNNPPNPREIMRKYSQMGFTRNELGARKVVKEKEYKVDARGGKGRLFVTLHPEFRIAAGLLNNNVKSGLLKYFPYTSMSMSSNELIEFLSSATNPVSDALFLNLGIDFSGWNSRFLQALMRLTGAVMDGCFGVHGYYGRIHDHFRKFEMGVHAHNLRVNNLEDPALRAARVSGPTMWYDDSTGNEGIAQREWTMVTVCMIYFVLMSSGFPYKNMGTGDNQVAIIKMLGVQPGDAGREADRIMRAIEQFCEKANQTAKPEEFEYSSSVIFYGKVPYVRGEAVPLISKPSARISHATSEITPNFDDSLGAIMSGALGVARVSNDTMASYHLGLIHLELFCRRVARTGGPFRVSNSTATSYGRMAMILLDEDIFPVWTSMNSAIGGFPLPSWSNFIWSHDPDPLSQIISELKCTGQSASSRKLSEYLKDPESYQTDPDSLTLLDNPSGLPLRVPALASSLYKDLAEQVVLRSNNPHMSSLAQLSLVGSRGLRARLIEQRPLYPQIAQDMYSISVYGKAQKITQKFKSTGTLMSQVINSTDQREFESRAHRRSLQIVVLISGISNRPGLSMRFNRPSHQESSSLRLRWGLGIGGIQGLDTVAPLDYTIDSEVLPGIRAHRVPHIVPGRSGPFKAYLGSKTMEHREAEKFLLAQTPGSEDLRKLVLSATAGAVEPSLLELYDQIARSRCTQGIAELIRLLPNIAGGTPAHRYEDMSGGGIIGPIGVSGRRTWYQINSDDVPGISATNLDYPIPMQSFMSLVIWSAVQRDDRVTRINLSNTGLFPMADPIRTIDGPTIPYLPRVESNPLVFVRELEILSAVSMIIGTRENLQDIRPRDQYRCLTGIFYLDLISNYRTSPEAELGVTTGDVDMASLISIGDRAVFQACCESVALASIWWMSSYTERAEFRFQLDVVIGNLARVVAQKVSPALKHPRMNLNYLRSREIWLVSAGSSGFRVSMSSLVRSIEHSARTLATDQAALLRVLNQTVLPDSHINLPRLFEFSHKIMGMLWCISLSNTQLFGQLKSYFRGAMRVIRDTPASESISSTYAISVSESLTSSLRMISGLDLSMILEVQLFVQRPLRTARATTLQVYRHLRSVTDQNSHIRPRPVGPVGEQGGVNYELHTTLFSAPLTLPDGGAGLNIEQRMQDRVRRVYGLRSTLRQVWKPHLLRARGAVAVVGTGAGSIQMALRELGLPNLGLDLAEIIPPELATTVELLVPESDEQYQARYSPLMLSTSGNWFEVGEMFINQVSATTVVIDIQNSSSRSYLEVLTPLLTMGFSGLVIVRLDLTEQELGMAIGHLDSSPGFSNIRASPFYHYHGRGVVQPWVVEFRMGRNARLTNQARVANITSVISTILPPPAAHDVPRLMSIALRVLSDGYLNHTSLADARTTAQQVINSYSPQRGTTSGGSGLTLLRCLIFIDHVIEHSSIDSVQAALIPFTPRRTRQLWVRSGDLPLTYMFTHFYVRVRCLYDETNQPSQGSSD